jgi:branched-chain amino acid transport system substrate-binding protein
MFCLRPFVTGAIAVSTLAVFGSAHANECGEIVLGAALSETGKYSVNGKNTREGYEFAVEKIRKAGGVKVGDKCYNFKIKYYDDESTPARAAQLAERLISQDNVQYLLGPYSSGLTKAVAPATEKYKIPMVEAEGASRSLFTQG